MKYFFNVCDEAPTHHRPSHLAKRPVGCPSNSILPNLIGLWIYIWTDYTDYRSEGWFYLTSVGRNPSGFFIEGCHYYCGLQDCYNNFLHIPLDNLKCFNLA